jgi:anti-sigma factor ChrR (cupin superfamily)
VLKESEPISQAETKRAPIIQPTQGEAGIEGLSRTISSARSPQVRATPQPPRALRETIVEGVSVVRPDAADWQPHPLVGGVVVKLLFRDPESGRYTALIRISPGTSLPPRLHAGYEEMLVIAGTAVVGESEIRAAEYCRAEPGSTHPAIATATGCTLFVSGSELDEVLPNNT